MPHRYCRAIALGILAGALLPAAHAQPKAAARVPRPPAGVSVVVATVNGVPITRGDVALGLLADQTARLYASRAEFVDRKGPLASLAGALLLKKLGASGGKPVTVSTADVVNYMFSEKSPELLGAVQTVISERVVRQAAKARGIAASPEEVRSRLQNNITEARNTARLGGLNDARVLASLGVREASLRRNVENNILLEKLLVDDIERRNGHKLEAADYADVSDIFVRVAPNTPAETEKAFADGLKKAQKLEEDIRARKISFEETARQFSEDESRFNNGSMGMVIRGTQAPELDKVIFSAEPGIVNPPIRASNGWYILRVNRQGKDTTGPERAQILRFYMQNNQRRFLITLVGKAKVVNKLLPPTPNPAVSSPQPSVRPALSPEERERFREREGEENGGKDGRVRGRRAPEGKG